MPLRQSCHPSEVRSADESKDLRFRPPAPPQDRCAPSWRGFPPRLRSRSRAGHLLALPPSSCSPVASRSAPTTIVPAIPLPRRTRKSALPRHRPAAQLLPEAHGSPPRPPTACCAASGGRSTTTRNSTSSKSASPPTTRPCARLSKPTSPPATRSPSPAPPLSHASPPAQSITHDKLSRNRPLVTIQHPTNYNDLDAGRPGELGARLLGTYPPQRRGRSRQRPGHRRRRGQRRPQSPRRARRRLLRAPRARLPESPPPSAPLTTSNTSST